ncbi:hypothetical protein ACOSP7_003359 [Xanthoceras sorbifolium]
MGLTWFDCAPNYGRRMVGPMVNSEVNIAVYLINRGPSVPLDGGIPEEVWSGKEVTLSHLRVFGCISYVHIDSAEGSKLDAKSSKCVFVDYGGDEFGYRF